MAGKKEEVAALQGRGRVLVRPSGTEQLVRVMVEAGTDEIAQAAAERVAERISGRLPPEAALLAHIPGMGAAVARGLPGQVATLILPADVSWGDGALPCPPPPRSKPPPPISARRWSSKPVRVPIRSPARRTN